ncbi:MAG: FAD-dependent oxidoreductase, partial [Pseudomonadota bacterium]
MTLVVGSGPVGMRVGQLLAQRGIRTLVLGDERHEPYNRVRLTPLLSGDVQFGDITLGPSAPPTADLTVQVGERVIHIDRTARCVETASGAVLPYATLVLATGSRAFVPGIPGAGLPGVYTFRTADDASALLARSVSARQ